MLEIGESCVKPIAEIDRDGWKVSLDYRIGKYGRFLQIVSTDFRKKNQKKIKIAYKRTFRGPIEVLKVDFRTVFHADLGY